MAVMEDKAVVTKTHPAAEGEEAVVVVEVEVVQMGAREEEEVVQGYLLLFPWRWGQAALLAAAAVQRASALVQADPQVCLEERQVHPVQG